MAVPTRADFNALLRDRIAGDPDFRAAVLADPRAAVGELVGVPLPHDVTVTVHEESLTDIYIVLPPRRASGEIAEEDLDLVAGGSVDPYVHPDYVDSFGTGYYCF